MTAPDRPARTRPRATHTCPCGCGRRIANSRLVCRDTWALVPIELRQHAKQLDQQLFEAMCAILAWVGDHPTERAGTRRDGRIRQAPTPVDGREPAGTS